MVKQFLHMDPASALLCILLCLACSCGSRQQKDDSAAGDRFLKLFSETGADTLIVYSAQYPEADTFRFKGRRIDSTFFHLLALETKETGWWGGDAFPSACCRFPIDSGRLGLIVRLPSEYINSSISLFVWDMRSKKMTGRPLLLAEMVGDAGWNFNRDSWIMRDPAGVSVFTHTVECEEETDDSADNSETETDGAEAGSDCTDTFELYVFDNGWVHQKKLPENQLNTLIRRFRIDTIKTN